MVGKLKPKRKNRTPESAPTRMRESPLDRLKRKRVLNVYELTAADEIIAGFQMSQGLPVSRDTDLGIPASEPRAGAADDTAARRSDILTKYHAWKADLRTAASAAYTAVCAVLFHEESMRQIERAYGWRNGSAMAHLLVGLRHFAALRGNTPRGARGWKVETARAAA